MRARNLKPSFFTNEDLGTLPPLARLLFQGLWCEADCEGRLEDRPRRLKTMILPYDECDADALLADLNRIDVIHRYEVNGKKFIVIPAFKKHQHPHMSEREKGSEIPPPDHYGKKPDQSGVKPDSKPDQSGGIPLTESLLLNPESGILTPEEEEDPPTPQGEIDETRPAERAHSGNTRSELKAVINSYTDDPALRQALEDFRAMRERIRKPMTGKALDLILAKLDGLARDGPGKIAVLEQSVLNSWQGVFPIKNQPQLVVSGSIPLSAREQRTVDAVNAFKESFKNA